MSVIIRLQNLPWSANALDIRQFFKGLSIPEGGVHIVGGEMGDAFIAFSMDEDARQAMMFDRKAINGVQIRLLLSSRAEMQKVIETARQQSLLALKNASLVATAKSTPPTVVPKPIVNLAPLPPVISASSFQNIMANPLAATPSFLAYQQQAGITLTPDLSATDDSETRHSRDRRQSESRDDRRRSRSRERSVFRRRRERSRERSRDSERGRRSTRRSRSRERSRTRTRDHSRDRSRDRSRERSRNSRDNSSRRNSRDNNIRPRNVDVITKPKQNASSWNAYQANYNSMDSSMSAVNAQQLSKLSGYQANFNSLDSTLKSNINAYQLNKQQPGQLNAKNMFAGTVGKAASATVPSSVAATVSVSAVSTTFQNYNTNKASLTALNNYSLSSLLSGASTSTDSLKGFALQNPYTTALQTKSQESFENTTTSTSTIPGIFLEKKSDAIASTMQPSQPESVLANNMEQETIAFSTVNPYEQMYPNLFAQAAAIGGIQKSNVQAGKKPLLSLPNSSSSPTEDEFKSRVVDPNETNTVKICNMCSRTTYSDLRKFFVGLFIPHNGIKMINDKHGLRVGKAYVQFSRQSSVAKALCRCNTLLKGMSVTIEPVAEEEFDKAEDSFRPINQRGNESDHENAENTDGNNSIGFSPLNPYKKIISTDPFCVLYIEDIPALVTEQDIIKMFSSYSLYDILLLSSPENRREFVAHVRFSREDDAKSAYEDRAHHQIGYRRLRMRPGTIEDMENAKEKIRLANEQLMKEEQEAQVAAEEEETKRKLEKLITEQITREEEKHQQEQNIVSMDLTEEDGEEDENDDDVIETTNEMKADNERIYDDENDADDYGDVDNSDQLSSNQNYSLSDNNSNNTFNNNTRRLGPNNIPSLFDVDPIHSNLNSRSERPALNDPRLRSGANNNNNNNVMMMGANNFNNFNPNFNNHQTTPQVINSIERNFVVLKNCEYNTRINDVAQLFLTANLGLKHIEPLRNERHLPSGEFIVEFRRTQDAEIALQKFHNIQFRNRSLRVFAILPQEIADRLGKPFLSYIPGGPGPRINGGGGGGGMDNMGRNSFNKTNNLINNNMNNLRFGINPTHPTRVNFNSFRAGNDNLPIKNNSMRGGSGNGVMASSTNMNISNDMSDNMSSNTNDPMNNYTDTNGMPEKFSRPGCVLSLENVPYKATLSDILSFFQDYELTDNDIIRRFNDDGSPTGDARVAFVSPDVARDAFEMKKRKQMFGRTIFLNII